MAEPKLIVALEARLNKFEKQLSDAGVIAERQVKKIEDRFARSNPGSNFLAGLAKGAIAAFTLDRAIRLVTESIKEMAKIGEVSERVGIRPEQLQEISFALEQSGGDAAQAADGMQKFANNLAKAAQANSDLGRFLAKNGVALKDVNGNLRPAADLLADIANLIQNARSPQERLNIAMEFFGRQAGPAFATALASGAQGLRNFGAEAQRSGAVIEDELIKRAKEIDDQWTKFARTMGTEVKGAILAVVDAAARLANLSVLAAKLDDGSISARELAQAIAFARSQGSPVDPSWLKDLERLTELERERNRGRFATTLQGSTLPGAANTGRPTDTSPLGGGATKSDQFKQDLLNMEKRIALQRAELKTIDDTTFAREKLKIETELLAEAEKANAALGLKNTEATAAQKTEINRLAEEYANLAAKIDQAKLPLREFARDAANVTKGLHEVGVNGLKGFEDALIDIGMGAKSAKDAFKDMAASILQDLARLIIRLQITGPLALALSSALGGSPVGMPMNILPRAGGGPVSARSPYLVGEQGPELFVPKTAGQIVPNSVMSRSGVGGSVINIHQTIDARGSTLSESRVRQIVNEGNNQLRREIIPITREGRSRKIA